MSNNNNPVSKEDEVNLGSLDGLETPQKTLLEKFWDWFLKFQQFWDAIPLTPVRVGQVFSSHGWGQLIGAGFHPFFTFFVIIGSFISNFFAFFGLAKKTTDSLAGTLENLTLKNQTLVYLKAHYLPEFKESLANATKEVRADFITQLDKKLKTENKGLFDIRVEEKSHLFGFGQPTYDIKYSVPADKKARDKLGQTLTNDLHNNNHHYLFEARLVDTNSGFRQWLGEKIKWFRKEPDYDIKYVLTPELTKYFADGCEFRVIESMEELPAENTPAFIKNTYVVKNANAANPQLYYYDEQGKRSAPITIADTPAFKAELKRLRGKNNNKNIRFSAEQIGKLIPPNNGHSLTLTFAGAFKEVFKKSEEILTEEQVISASSLSEGQEIFKKKLIEETLNALNIDILSEIFFKKLRLIECITNMADENPNKNFLKNLLSEFNKHAKGTEAEKLKALNTLLDAYAAAGLVGEKPAAIEQFKNLLILMKLAPLFLENDTLNPNLTLGASRQKFLEKFKLKNRIKEFFTRKNFFTAAGKAHTAAGDASFVYWLSWMNINLYYGSSADTQWSGTAVLVTALAFVLYIPLKILTFVLRWLIIKPIAKAFSFLLRAVGIEIKSDPTNYYELADVKDAQLLKIFSEVSFERQLEKLKNVKKDNAPREKYTEDGYFLRKLQPNQNEDYYRGLGGIFSEEDKQRISRWKIKFDSKFYPTSRSLDARFFAEIDNAAQYEEVIRDLSCIEIKDGDVVRANGKPTLALLTAKPLKTNIRTVAWWGRGAPFAAAIFGYGVFWSFLEWAVSATVIHFWPASAAAVFFGAAFTGGVIALGAFAIGMLVGLLIYNTVVKPNLEGGREELAIRYVENKQAIADLIEIQKANALLEYQWLERYPPENPHNAPDWLPLPEVLTTDRAIRRKDPKKSFFTPVKKFFKLLYKFIEKAGSGILIFRLAVLAGIPLLAGSAAFTGVGILNTIISTFVASTAASAAIVAWPITLAAMTLGLIWALVYTYHEVIKDSKFRNSQRFLEKVPFRQEREAERQQLLLCGLGYAYEGDALCPAAKIAIEQREKTHVGFDGHAAEKGNNVPPPSQDGATVLEEVPPGHPGESAVFIPPPPPPLPDSVSFLIAERKKSRLSSIKNIGEPPITTSDSDSDKNVPPFSSLPLGKNVISTPARLFGSDLGGVAPVVHTPPPPLNLAETPHSSTTNPSNQLPPFSLNPRTSSRRFSLDPNPLARGMLPSSLLDQTPPTRHRSSSFGSMFDLKSKKPEEPSGQTFVTNTGLTFSKTD